MDRWNLAWTILAALVAAGWVVLMFIRDRIQYMQDWSSAVMARLLENDQLVIENPDVQKYLSLHAGEPEEFFGKEAVLMDDQFFKAKAYVYRQLNIFDEIFSLSEAKERWHGCLLSGKIIEIDDWRVYIKMKLRHPLFRYVLKNEGAIFGASLRAFWAANSAEIEKMSSNPHMW